jgi:hypothetical protein
MAKREHAIQVVLNDHEIAVLDERRGTTPRATYLRQQLHGLLRRLMWLRGARRWPF